MPKAPNNIEKVRPFDTKEVIAELPTTLPAGSYVARYKIFNQDDVKQEGEVSLSILPHGTLATAGYGFGGLSLVHKATIIVPLFLVLVVLWFLMRKAGVGNRKKKR